MNNIEATLYYTVNDARDLINDIGLSSFLEALLTEGTSRLLTIEEKEAMQLLHDNWGL